MKTLFSVQRSMAAVAASLLLVSGCQKKEETPQAGVAPSAPKAARMQSAEKNSFDQVTSKLDPGGNFYLYVSTEQFLSDFTNSLEKASNFTSALPNIPGDGRATLDKVFTVVGSLIKDSGLSQVSGLGMSSIAREPHFYYNKVILHHYAGQNDGLMWSMFGRSPHPLQILNMLPENTALAGSSDFDLAQAWSSIVKVGKSVGVPEVGKNLDELPGKFHDATMLDWDDVLKSLGGEYGVVLTLDQQKKVTIPLGEKSIEIPSPALCVIIKVNSGLIYDRVEMALTNNPILGKMMVRTDEADLKMMTVLVPVPIPVEVRPSIARMGDYLVVSSTDSLIREMAAVKSGKKKGFTSTEGFKKLSEGVPTDGNNFTLGTSSFVRSMGQMGEHAMAMHDMDADTLKSFHEMLEKTNQYGAFSVGLNGPEGWEGVGNGASTGAAMMALPAVATAAIGAAVALPALAKAKESAQKTRCISNLRSIELAKKLWAQDKNKQGSDTPTMDDLKSYVGGDQNVELLKCPSGGTYTVGAVNEKPTCSIENHALPQ